ncbi:sporulation protein YqfD [Alloiococcus sp. CFN-8]|uniref:sporulation protein YqfD n=1 Tax=Alloiococcus sp. CFN-8 TaxID=3416081 RepID=UPI003CFBA720
MWLKNLNRGSVLLEISCMLPEKLINTLWLKGVECKNICRLNLTTYTLEIYYKDYGKFKSTCKEQGVKYKLCGRKGLAFYYMKIKRNIALTVGVVIFLMVLYLLSNYVWSVEIKTDKYIAPYEIRTFLYSAGIKPGVKKEALNVKDIEENILKKIDNAMWARVRIEGSRLRVRIEERTPPPEITKNEGTNDVIASEDGEIVRIYTHKGTAVVKPGDQVKKGQLLIKGVEGKEGLEYQVFAEGTVLAKTFEESHLDVKTEEVTEAYTGDKDSSVYIYIKGLKIYLKKPTKKFLTYDKIEDSNGFIRKVVFKEIEQKIKITDEEEAEKNAAEKMTREKLQDLSKNSRLLDSMVFSEPTEMGLRVRVLFIIEKDIAIKSEAN